MMLESINVIKQGAIVRQFPSSDYSLVMTGSFVVIQSKVTRAPEVVISPEAFDYIEIEREEVHV